MKILLSAQAFDPWREIVQHQSEQPGLWAKYGATAVFVGTLRDFNQGATVQAMTLEHYAPMTQKHLERIVQEAAARQAVEDILVVHRYGELHPNEPIVLVAVWSAHRDAAFVACRYIIDELKTRAPFWKQEAIEGGRRWVAPEASES